MERKLKIALCIAVIILITVISFVGVYSSNGIVFKNNLPSYALGSEFGGKRVSKLVVNAETKEVIYDKDGKQVDSIPDGANEEDYRKEQEKINKDENRTVENYRKVKEILEGRLKTLKVEDYLVRVDENTGNAIVELGDGVDTDTTLQYLLCNGDFSITDATDKTVLLDKSDVEDVKVLYSRGGTSGVTVYLDFVFNKEGKEKLAEVSRNYLKSEENKDNNQNTDNNENQDAENTDNTNSGENADKEDETKTTEKQVTLTIEGNALLTTSFGEEMLTGELPISLGSATDSESLQEYANQGNFYAMLINNDTMPLEYEMGTTDTVKGEINGAQNLYIIVGVIAAITILIIVFMIYKFKLDGVFAGISFIATISILLLEMRYTRTEISLNAISAGFIMILLDAYLVYKMLNNINKNNTIDNVRKTTIRTYLENIEVIIVSLILAIIFTFMQYAKVFSFGMTLFYGIISIGITNMVFLRTMLIAKYKPSKYKEGA